MVIKTAKTTKLVETKTLAQYCIYQPNNVFGARNLAYHRWSISYIFTAPQILIHLSLQFAAAFLGEHSEEPSLHFRRARERGRGRLFVRHSSDLHGRLHENRAQTQSGKCLRISYRHIKTRNTSFIDFLSLSCLQDSPSNKLLYAKEISTYKRMVDE